MSQSPTNIISDDNAGNVVLDLSGWVVAWNFVQTIPMSGGAWEAGFTSGQAKLTCGTDCSNGDTYTLDYSATVPADCGNCGFENVPYHLRMVGTVFVPNQPPTAIADTIDVNAGESATINITTNGSDDLDGDNALLTVGSLVQGLWGTATGTGSDTITYTHDGSATSSDSFTYTVIDELSLESAPATATVNINAFPIANNDSPGVTVSEASNIDVLSNDTDADGNATIDVTSVTIISAPNNGTAIANSTTGIVVYTNDGTSGPDNFTYTIADDKSAVSNTATVNINVAIDPLPTCNGTTLSPDQDTSITFDVVANSSPGGAKSLDPASVAITTDVTNGTTGINATTGIITYTPDAGYVGADSFTFTIDDDSQTCVPAAVNIDVLSTNTAPVANNDSDISITTTTVNTALTINVKANDTDDDDIANSTVTITNTPINGSANAETDGTVTYTPDTGYSGTDSFTYNLTDAGNVQSANATVSVTVAANNPSSSTGTLTPGSTADSVSSTDGRVTIEQIGVPDNGSSDQQGIAQSCIGGCFDFIVTGLTGGADAQVVLPLSIAIPAPATAGNSLIYRKLTATGWANYDTSDNNAIHTAAGLGSGSNTVCPAASDAVYDTSPGLTEGDRCVRLTIVDNGPNDTDASDGTVADPSGIGESFSIDTRVSGTDGCSMSELPLAANQRADWWIVAGFMGILGLLRLKRNKA